MVFSSNNRIGLPILIKLDFRSRNKNNSSKISFIPALIRKPQGARYIHQPRDKAHAEQSRGYVQEDKAQRGYKTIIVDS